MYAENTGQFEEFITILKKRKWQIALPAVFILALSMVLALIIPGKYLIESKLELNRHYSFDDQETKVKRNNPIDSEGPNAEEHLKSYERVRRVLGELAWDEYANLRDPVLRKEYIRNQIDSIFAQTPDEWKPERSLFVTLTYKHVDPQKGVDFIHELVRTWIADLIERDISSLTQARDEAQNYVDRARRKYVDASNKVAELEGQMRLSSRQKETNAFGQPTDRFESASSDVLIKLQEAEAEKAGIEAQLEAIELELQTMSDTVAKTTSGRPSNLAAKMNALEADIASYRAGQAGLTPQHSKWKRLQNLIEAKEAQLEELASTTEVVLSTTESVPNEEKLALIKKRDELKLELSKAQATYDSLLQADQKLQALMDTRMRLDSQLDQARNESEQAKLEHNEAYQDLNIKQGELAKRIRENETPFTWSRRPTAPPDPTEPNPFLIIAIGLVGGLGVGLGSSVVVEFSKNCYRNVGDVTAIMTLPILGVVNEIVTSEERRSMRIRAGVMISSSVLMLTVIGWFTWAYTRNQELLPTSVLVQLEEFRNQFE